MTAINYVKAEDLMGVGLYSIGDASKLIGVSPQRLSSWFYDHSYTKSKPMYNAKLGDEFGKVLTFDELIESHIVYKFNSLGISMQKIREATAKLSEMHGTKHPLLDPNIKTDGYKIFLEDSENEKTLDIHTNQENFTEIIKQTFKNIDYNNNYKPLRWWPAGHDAGIVIDPERSFGEPILDKSRIPTRTLFKIVNARVESRTLEESFNVVAHEFDLDFDEVKSAYNFERLLHNGNSSIH